MVWLQIILKRLSRMLRSAVIGYEGSFYWFLSQLQAAGRGIMSVRETGSSTGGVGGRSWLSLWNLLNPIFLFSQAWGVGFRWLLSRDIRKLIGAIPALACASALISCGLVSLVVSTGHLDAVRGAMREAVQKDDTARYDFLLRKWSSSTPEQPDAYVFLAKLLRARDPAVSREVIESGLKRYPNNLSLLIPYSDIRFRQYIQDGPDISKRRELMQMLVEIVTAVPTIRQPQLNLAKLYLLEGQPKSAQPAVFDLTEYTPLQIQDPPEERRFLGDAWLTRCYVEQALGETVKSRRSASNAYDCFISVPSLNFDNWCVMTVRALLSAGRESEAAFLVNGYLVRLQVEMQEKGATEEQRALEQVLKTNMAEVYIAEARRIRSEGNSPEEIARAIQSLENAIRAAPLHPPVTEELALQLLRSEVGTEDLNRVYQTALDNGISPGVIHFLQGTRLATADPPDAAAARREFEQAMAHDISAAGLLNNLANLIADTEAAAPEDLRNAEAMVESALQLFPGLPAFLDTRGKLHLRLGEPLKAIASFELALKDARIRSEVNRNLAKAYRVMGDESRALYYEGQGTESQ